MIPLFLGLTIANLAALLATVVLGYVAVSGNASIRGWHMLGGTLAAILCIAVHCIVLTYFIATAKWIQHAVTVKGLDATYVTPTRSFKALAFPAALGAILAVFITAIFGAAVDTHVLGTIWHHLMALTAIGVNLFAAAVEYGAIQRNGQLIDRMLAEMPPPGTESGAM